MTAAMVKGATAGNLLADAIQRALGWVKEFTFGSVMLAAENAKAEAGVRAMAQAHGVSAAAAARHVAAIEQIGFEYTEAAQAVKRFLIADLDLSKAGGLAKLAKDAAAIQNVAAGEALEALIMAIESGYSRGLRSLGLFVDFQREALAAQLRLGRALTDAEEKQVRYNAVIREGAKIQGAHAAVLRTAAGQLGALRREFQNLREEIGARFESDLAALLGHLRELVRWLRDNADGLVKLAQAVAAVGAALATYKLADKILALAKSIAALNLATLNPYALLGVAAVGAGLAVYAQWRRGQEEVEARFSEMERRALRLQLLTGKVRLEELRRRGMTDDELRELVAGRRALPGEQSFEMPGPKVTLEAAPDLESLKRAAEIRKRQVEAVRATRESALAAEAEALKGPARVVLELQREAQRLTTFVDERGVMHRFTLLAEARHNLERQLQVKLRALQKETIEETLKRYQEEYEQRLAWETELYQRRLDYQEDAARRALEQRKMEIEVAYLEQVNEIKLRLFDLETSRVVLEEEANLRRLGYRVDEIRARIAELTQQREDIRREQQEATDAAIQATRENAAVRHAELIRDHNRQIFDSLKRQAEGVFDALLTRSQSVFAAIGNALKTAVLTAVKEIVTSRVAALLMQLFAGARFPIGAGVGGGRLGALLGIGAVPVLGGSVPTATPPFVPNGRGLGLAGPVSGWKEFLGIGGSVQLGPGMATTWQAATLGQKLSAIGHSPAAALGGGLLALTGLQRGGLSGLAMTTAGGGRIGFKCLMESLGADPNPTPFGFDTDNPVERAADTAFVMLRRADAKGLQLSRLAEHAMEVVVAQGLSGWVWTAPGVRSQQVLTNPVWIAVNMLLRARGLRFADAATCEQFFDVDAAIAAAQICDQQVTKLVGTGSETQFKFRGVIQEEKPLRDWIQEVLMNSLGYYTFAFGKLKLGVRVNSSAVEAFTEGNILFGSLQLAPLKPSFNHLTANFADEDFNFVANSISLYDIDHAALIGGGAGPLFLKSTVNLSGTASKSQAARIITTRLREELGGITPAEWKAARQIAFKTTVLALNTEPGMVCSMTHPDMPGGAGEFRVTSWRLNRDYSIDIQGRTTTDSMYNLLTGPKPADVVPEPVPEEILIDTGVPGVLSGTPKLGDYGTWILDNMSVAPDASGNLNIVGAHEITLALYYVDELAADLWASIDAAVDAATDPLTVACTVNPATSRVFEVGDFVVFNDEAQDAANPGRRSYECAQITAINANQFTFQRAYPGVPSGQATFGTLRCAHQAGIRFYKLDRKIFTFSVKKGFFRTPGLPARIEAKLPSACIVAAVVGVANHFGYGPFTVFPLSHHNEPFMPGDRTCNGGAYTFQIPGPLAVQNNVAIPMKVQDAASIRCIYAYLQQGTTDGQSAYLVKISRDGGATWESLEYMGIAQSIPTPFKTTYDYLVEQGYGRPETRRLPYNDFGIVLAQAVTAGPNPQTVQTGSYGANRLGLEAGEFVHINLGQADEEYVQVLAADPDNQTFTAIFTKDHAVGATVRPTIWPTPVLNEGDDLAFDILAVASPDPGSDLTVVIQT